MASDIEIYWIAGSPYAWRVLLALELKEVAYISRILEAAKKEQKSPEFLAVNPSGKVPALRCGNYVATESLAILAYLDRKFPQPGLFGATPEEAGDIWRMVLDFDTTLCPTITDRFNRPLFRGRAEEMAQDIKAAADEIQGALAGFEARVAGRGWLVGADISAADIALYPFIEALLRAAGKDGAGPLELGFLPFGETYPALQNWRERIKATPRYDDTVPPHWRAA